MTDLLHILPGFDTRDFAHILPLLEKHLVTTTDLITLDAFEVAQRAQLPLPDIRRLVGAVLRDLGKELGYRRDGTWADGGQHGQSREGTRLKSTAREQVQQWSLISTLDASFDAALAGGIPTGYLTEVTGESGAGKTLFLLQLLLSVQLSPPDGISKNSLYISTEAPLPTTRLAQLLKTHPRLKDGANERLAPSLSRVLSINTPDLESQDHILQYQLPVAVRRNRIGLVVLDSVAANYRAEYEGRGAVSASVGPGGAAMAKRSAELVRLGGFLRDLARRENIAIVVANQVADRFAPRSVLAGPLMVSTDIDSSPISQPSIPSTPQHISYDIMSLDHQQRFFTGWGDISLLDATSLKTPSLGQSWTSQLSARIALLKAPSHVRSRRLEDAEVDADGSRCVMTAWHRTLKVVFAAWAPASGIAVNHDIQASSFIGDLEDKGFMPSKGDAGSATVSSTGVPVNFEITANGIRALR